MEYEVVVKLVQALLEEAEIDVVRDMWRWTSEDEDCNPEEEVLEGIAVALSLFLSNLSGSAQEEIKYEIHRFSICPTVVKLEEWRIG